MKRAIFFLLDDYADWEGAYLSSSLNQKNGWEVKTASIQKEVNSIGGFTTKIDIQLENLPTHPDLFILIGGNSWSLINSALKQTIENYLAQGVVVGAICGAVDYLAKNGLLNNYKHTGNSSYLWSDFENYTNIDNFIEQQAVVDQNLVTANGTAPLEFTEMILKAIKFDANETIEKEIYMKRFGFYRYCQKYGNPFF